MTTTSDLGKMLQALNIKIERAEWVEACENKIEQYNYLCLGSNSSYNLYNPLRERLTRTLNLLRDESLDLDTVKSLVR